MNQGGHAALQVSSVVTGSDLHQSNSRCTCTEQDAACGVLLNLVLAKDGTPSHSCPFRTSTVCSLADSCGLRDGFECAGIGQKCAEEITRNDGKDVLAKVVHSI